MCPNFCWSIYTANAAAAIISWKAVQLLYSLSLKKIKPKKKVSVPFYIIFPCGQKKKHHYFYLNSVEFK